MRARSANSEGALAGDEEDVDDGFTEKGNANRSTKRLYAMAVLITFCLTLCALAKRLDNAAASPPPTPRGSWRRPRPPPRSPPSRPRPPRPSPRTSSRAAAAAASGPGPAAAAAAAARGAAAAGLAAQAMKLVDVSPVYEAPTLPKVLCVIYTHSKHHSTAGKAASETWLPRCDGALILSDESDETVGAVGVPHEGPGASTTTSGRRRATNWRYVHEYYRGDFDYFHFGGDDLFVLVSNLKAYLASPPVKARNDRGEPLFLGRLFKQNGNEEPLQLGRQRLHASTASPWRSSTTPSTSPSAGPTSTASSRTSWSRSASATGPRTSCPRTRATRTGAAVHPFTPGQHLSYRKTPNDRYTKYARDLIEGERAAGSRRPSAVKPDLMVHMDAILHRCPSH
ncbi:glycoprotein-N-acetylgalactosamine 3-beta-galactosyltransferase [Aureococcus anophagefferens]|uniref:Glycoprotein-N-acetylgalactosamine 3-beta-galactosyltransferase n=1 Tax=Aureococcus anophagefferens TaxID=44056 RepID=A0ABR1FIH5_AURAN